jgi:hypothetical protein
MFTMSYCTTVSDANDNMIDEVSTGAYAIRTIVFVKFERTVTLI